MTFAEFLLVVLMGEVSIDVTIAVVAYVRWVSEVQWLSTAQNPRRKAHTCTADDGQVGWRLHAVVAFRGDTFKQLGCARALCGLSPVHGWGMDLFIDDDSRCKRCLRRLEQLRAQP